MKYVTTSDEVVASDVPPRYLYLFFLQEIGRREEEEIAGREDGPDFRSHHAEEIPDVG